MTHSVVYVFVILIVSHVAYIYSQNSTNSDRLCYAIHHPHLLAPCNLTYYSDCLVSKLISFPERELLTSKLFQENTSCSTDFVCPGNIDLSILKARSGCKGSRHGKYLWGVTWIKNDSNLLIQWIIWHLSIGFDHILIYDNLSTDNLRLSLGPFMKAGLVERLRFPGLRGQHTQVKSFNNALKKCRDSGVRWLAAFDSDEFISMSSHRCLTTFLRKIARNKTVGGLALNWRWISAPGKIWRERTANGSRRFITVMEEAGFNTGVGSDTLKSIVYVNRTIKLASMHHGEYFPPAVAIAPSSGHAVVGPFHSPPELNDLSMLHFHTRSFEEFLLKIDRWRTTSYFPSHCPNCEADLQTLSSEYLRWLNSTNTRVSRQTYNPQLAAVVQHLPTEKFMRTKSSTIYEVLNYCLPK
eukprot:gene13814-29375_t